PAVSVPVPASTKPRTVSVFGPGASVTSPRQVKGVIATALTYVATIDWLNTAFSHSSKLIEVVPLVTPGENSSATNTPALLSNGPSVISEVAVPEEVATVVTDAVIATDASGPPPMRIGG